MNSKWSAANWFILIVVVGALVSIGISFYNNVILRNFIVSAETICDPAIEKCFTRECFPAYERCTEGETLIYKIVKKKANAMPQCDPFSGACDQLLTCGPNEAQCQIVYCDPANLEEDQQCVE